MILETMDKFCILSWSNLSIENVIFSVESVENLAIILKKFKYKNLEDFFVEFTDKFMKNYR